MEGTRQIRILIADDHEVVRKGLEMVLALEPDFQVVGEARTGQEALERVTSVRPDVLLLDLKMPGLSGVAVARRVKAIAPGTRVLILTGIEANEELFDAAASGIDGFILKAVGPETLCQAIRTVWRGQTYLPAAGSAEAHGRRRESPTLASPVGADLTSRELEVLQLLATSDTNRDIAEKMVVSEETVRSHVKSILQKLNQPNRTQAVLAALKAGLIELR